MYVPASNACNEPNSATPMTAAAIASQDNAVAAVGQLFLNGNAAVYDLVNSMGGNLPGLVPGVQAPAAMPVPATVPMYAAPGVLAAPTGPLVPAIPGGLPPNAHGPLQLGDAVKSMVRGCDVPWAGPQLGAQVLAGAASSQSGMWLMGLAALAAALYVLHREGATK